uniref:Uncharacterized protein n=1 Tax=Magnetospirillum gryphiswaldense TaxID=55518 RepID=A4U2K1_9PROT|nr:hypothetical protein MGR_0870 [Magnetospirillum gryphiswaldense MSR-1]
MEARSLTRGTLYHAKKPAGASAGLFRANTTNRPAYAVVLVPVLVVATKNAARTIWSGTPGNAARQCRLRMGFSINRASLAQGGW